MASSGAGDGGSQQPLLFGDERRPITSRSLPVKIDSRTANALKRLRSPRAQENTLAQAGKSVSSPPPQNEQESAGMSILVTALVGLATYLVIGIVSFSSLQQDFSGVTTSTLVDAMYFAVVTMTTVGYGDLVPRGVVAKLFTCAFVFVGFGIVGILVREAANYLVEKQEAILVRKFHLQQTEEIVDDDEVVAAKWKAAIAGAVVLILFVVGLLVLIFCEGMSFIDAFYCVCVTVTTLGYGDETFKSKPGRLFAVFWILSSTVCVAQFFLFLAESRAEERQRQLAIWTLSRPTTTSDLEAADLDKDGVVSAAEFVIYKLKELGKIDGDDVQEILKEFASLDNDQSGTLNWSDIMNTSHSRNSAHAA